MLENLERDLYWAYERSSLPVLTKSGDGLGGGGGDPYESHLDSILLQSRVNSLSALSREIILLKYGRKEPALRYIINLLNQEFGLPSQASELFVVKWLGLHCDKQMQSLTSILSCSKSTISKKCRKVCIWLDNLNLDALDELVHRYY